MNKDLLSFGDLTRDDFENIFARSASLKKMQKEGKPRLSLQGRTLGMIFEKSSTRTRISFEVGMYQLGGIALFLSSRDTQISRGEIIADTARIMSRYLDAIMIRTYAQDAVEEFAKYAEIPVINGLTDLLHPCQILSDIFTIREKKGTCEGLRVAYIGDGNNVSNSWLDAAARLPFSLSIACPEGYDPDGAIFDRALRESSEGVTLYRDPHDAIRGADVVYTDVWASMGQEDEHKKRVEIFRPYQINRELISHAGKEAIVMHCLPAHRGEEITGEVIDGPQSVVVDQAENRLHVQKAVLEILMGG